MKGQDHDEDISPGRRSRRRRTDGRPDGRRLRVAPGIRDCRCAFARFGARSSLAPARHTRQGGEWRPGPGGGDARQLGHCKAVFQLGGIRRVQRNHHLPPSVRTLHRALPRLQWRHGHRRRVVVPLGRAWVGLDGYKSATVEQTGLLAGCNGSTPEYDAWWEMYPKFPIYPSITVHAGNAIDMSVYYHSTTHQFTLNFSDTTNGQKFSKTVSCPSGSTCHRNSAEVISEAPYDTQISNLTPLADFQAASFTNAHITNTSGTHSGGFRSSGWNTYAITQISDGSNPDLAGTAIPAGTALDRPTPLYQNVTFLDYWMPANAK